MENYRDLDLLSNYCRYQLPERRSENAFIVEFHPALGILYMILAQKIRGGRLHEGAEWLMEVGEAYVENLDLEGILLILRWESEMGMEFCTTIVRKRANVRS